MLKKSLLPIVFSLVLTIVIPGIGSLNHLAVAQNQDTNEQTFIKDVSVKEANELIQKYFKSGDLIILDVRTDSEYKSGHLEGAINIDYYSENLETLLNKLDKTKPILVYCKSGARSRRTTNIMEGLGFKKIYNMEGGILDWEYEGLPAVKGD